MEKQQALEWAKAQKIVVSTDLIAAAKKQLQFLEVVDRNRQLYDGPALDRAISRYKNCWLPLLAKHAESKFPEGHFVVPLDCEWIWHCHKLNPVRYVTDCKELFGRILDTRNVLSSTQGACKKHTQELWKMMYPEEPYELNIALENKMETLSSTNYDLVSAVKRQTTFYYQVSRSYMKDDLFLEGAVERYKGFLHLIRRNIEMKSKCFCVPTYDIDLIWHSHQLHPVSYSKDVTALVGKVLEHDDTDSNIAKGGKLDIGSRVTTMQWEDIFGSRYWRAGAMSRGPAPSPLSITPQLSTTMSKKLSPEVEYQNLIRLPKFMLVEVFLEIVEVRNLPADKKSNLLLAISKKIPDLLFKTKRRLSLSSEEGVKKVATFQCEPTGELIFELISYSPLYVRPTERSVEILGTTSVSLQDLMNSASKLSLGKWLEFVPVAGTVGSGPISLNVALSATPPVPRPYALHMIKGYPLSRNPGFCPIPETVEKDKKWTIVVDEAGNEVVSILMRDPKKLECGNYSTSRKEVLGMAESGEACVLAEFNGEGWLLMGSRWFLPLQKKIVDDEYNFELVGSRKMIIFPGRKLGYEIKNSNKQENEGDFMTVVEFSSETPYGKAMALLNLRTSFMEVEEQQFVLPGITLAFILSDILEKDGYDILATRRDQKGDYRCNECGEGGSGADHDHDNMKDNLLSYCGVFKPATCTGRCSGTCSATCVSPCTSPCTS